MKVVYQGFIVLLCLHLAGCNGDFIWIGSNSDQSTDTAQTAPNSIDIQTDGETGAQILLQLSPGQTLQLKVITSSAPLSKSTLNNGVVWTSSDNSVLSVSSTGLVKALSLGSAFITATVGGRSSNAFGLDVVPPYIVSLELTPELNGINPQVGGSNAITSTMEYDASQTFTVTGTYNEGTVSDVSNSVTMNISDSGIATFSGPQMNAMAAGTSEVTASIGSITSNIVTVTTTSLSLCGGAVDDASSNTAT
ncbi:Ig-like domain-containing protein, partial [Enterovibrio norvegicus]|uniref:Ig-like domain-containing protein n=2 Tax=Enterovibrio TaxID=188143 RepID=UPI0003710FDA